MPSIMQRWMGRGNEIKQSYTISEQIAGAVDISRPVLSIMGALGVAGGAALAYKGIPAWDKCVIGFLAALLAFAGIHTFNDWVDKRRDVACWPARPIPSRRLKANQALLLALGAYAASLVIVWFVFNPTSFILSVLAIGLGSLYSGYLRDRVGYLVLPPIQSLGWLCGWAAFSPGTLFTSWSPWVLYLFSAAWQAGHIMVYSPLHPISHVNDKKLTQVPALFKRTSPKTAALIGFVFLAIAAVLSMYVGYYFKLGWLYYIPTAVMAVIAIVFCWQYLLDAENFGKGIKTFYYATYFMLAARVFLLLSVLFFS